MGNFFDSVISDFEMSLRGQQEIQNKKIKVFPNFAGSKFISQIVSQLKTILYNGAGYVNLDRSDAKKRIYRNADALILSMVLDETIKTENFLPILESFQNISIDIYLGLKTEGKFGKLQTELKNDVEEKEEGENNLIVT